MKELIAEIISKNLDLTEDQVLSLIEIPKDQTMGDFSFPCFSLAKEFKKNPVEIAKEIESKIRNVSEFEQIHAVGPYVNFFINRNLLVKKTLKEIIKKKDRYGSSKSNEKTVIEFPSPNTNKPLHIGHARNIILGQSAAKILSFSGDKVVKVNLNNDRGVHICKSMIAYSNFGNNDNPKKAKKKSDHFVGDYYVKFAQASAEDKTLEEQAQNCLIKWESGDKKTLEVWKKMNSWALEGFKETYKKFNLDLQKEYFESDIYKSGKSTIVNQAKQGVVKRKEDGAYFIDLSDKGLGEKILLRADGTSIYITQDLYLAQLKHKDFKYTKSIYVSAREQEHHFKVLFETLRRFGYSWADKLNHLSYGMVNLESGRMKSREGNVVDSDDLIDELKSLSLEELKKRWPELSKKEAEHRASIIAMAAMRYYFLKVDKGRDVTFKPEESIKFEGDTGPYLLYTYARAKSILEKSKYKTYSNFENSKISDSEKQIVSMLGNFPQVVSSAYKSISPNLIANYAYDLAQKFNEFYHSEQVLGSDQEKFRVSLVAAFSIVLKNALNLLDIQVLDKM